MQEHELTCLAEGINPVRYCSSCGCSNPEHICTECVTEGVAEQESVNRWEDQKLMAQFKADVIGFLFFVLFVGFIIVSFWEK